LRSAWKALLLLGVVTLMCLIIWPRYTWPALLLIGIISCLVTWPRHTWTTFLLVCAAYIVILPYNAVIKNSVVFWVVIIIGLAVSFICAASETAFGLACGEDSESETFKRNRAEQETCENVYLSEDQSISQEEKNTAKRRSEQLQVLLEIGLDYKSIYNPTLIVTNNVAIIVVAVISGIAQFEHAEYGRAHEFCTWLYGVVNSSRPELFRCFHLLGYSLPFPVSPDAFQSAFSLTVILIIGEILPKQIGSVFPAVVAEKLFWWLKVVSWISLGTGQTFGAVGLKLEKLLRSRFVSGRKTKSSQHQGYAQEGRRTMPSIIKQTREIATCKGGDEIFGHPQIFIKIGKGNASCPYCGQLFEFTDRQ
jgi:uncharacterized Zn-finger protein